MPAPIHGVIAATYVDDELTAIRLSHRGERVMRLGLLLADEPEGTETVSP